MPFLLKMAGQRDAVPYTAPFNTVLSRDLLLGILRGEISDAHAAAEWLDRHRSIGESPYTIRVPPA